MLIELHRRRPNGRLTAVFAASADELAFWKLA